MGDTRCFIPNHGSANVFAAEDSAEEVCGEDFLGEEGGGGEEEGAVGEAGGVDEEGGGFLWREWGVEGEGVREVGSAKPFLYTLSLFISCPCSFWVL